jgi:osmotically-inducible protein OsmY
MIAVPALAAPAPSEDRPLDKILSDLEPSLEQTPRASLTEILEQVRSETGAQEADSVMDQRSTPQDRETTAKIRREILRSEGLSTSARNVAIITRDGVVTLKGRVKTHDERRTIVAIAEKFVPAAKVDNAIELR